MKKKKPAKQAGNRAKNESNKGDNKGGDLPKNKKDNKPLKQSKSRTDLFDLLRRLQKAVSIKPDLEAKRNELENIGALVQYLESNKIKAIQLISPISKPLKVESRKLINDYILFCKLYYQNSAVPLSNRPGKPVGELNEVLTAGFRTIERLKELGVTDTELAEFFEVETEYFRRQLGRTKQKIRNWSIPEGKDKTS